MSSTIYTLLNMFIFVFWFRIWVPDTRDTFFNRYLAPIARLSDRVTDFLSPVFFGAPQQIIAAVSFFALIIMRGIAVPHDSQWTIFMGFERGVNWTDLPSCLVFSAASFMSFLFSIYGISLIYLRGRVPHNSHPAGMLFHVSNPLTLIKPEFRPMALLAMGMITVGLTDFFGTDSNTAETLGYGLNCVIDWSAGLTAVTFTKLMLVTLAAWVQVLGFLSQFVFFLVVISWVSAFTNSPHMRSFSRDWLNFLLGSFSSRPILIGTIDLTPLLFSFAIMFIHNVLMQIIISSIDKL